MLQEFLINLLMPLIHYISAFIIILTGTILTGLISIKSRDKTWVKRWQKNTGPLLLFVLVEAVFIYVGLYVLQPYLNIWLTHNVILIPSLLTEILILFYFWFNLVFGFKSNRLLIVLSQIFALGLGILAYTNIV